MQWLTENWQVVYGVGILFGWAIGATILFFGVWWYAASRYAFPGLAIGWVPALAAAVTGGLVIGILWPLVLIVAVALGGPIVGGVRDSLSDRL